MLVAANPSTPSGQILPSEIKEPTSNSGSGSDEKPKSGHSTSLTASGVPLPPVSYRYGLGTPEKST